MKKVKIISLVATLVMLAAFMTACASKQDVKNLANELENLANELNVTTEPETEKAVTAVKTLEDYYSDKKDAVNDSLESARLAQYADVYKEMSFDVKENDMVYVYVFADGVTAAAEDLKASLTTEMVEQQKDKIQAEAGIRPDTMSFIYKEADGTEIVTIEN